MQLSLQGNYGLGKAIQYFTSHSYPVMLPLNDTQKYDLVVDIDGLQRVSVKTSRFSKDGVKYPVNLKNSGGSSGKSVIRPFDNTSCDYIFIVTGDEKMYLIPSKDIECVSAMTVGGGLYSKYEVHSLTLMELVENMEH